MTIKIKILPIILAITLINITTLTGCQNIKNLAEKRDNGSLAYQKSTKLPPLRIPAQQASAQFIPLYPTPEVGNSELNVTNSTGSQYKLPKPPNALQQ